MSFVVLESDDSFVNLIDLPEEPLVLQTSETLVIHDGSAGVQDVTATAPLHSSGGNLPNITIDQADTDTPGYLSSVDWNTFNNKQSEPTPPASPDKSIQFNDGGNFGGDETFTWDDSYRRVLLGDGGLAEDTEKLFVGIETTNPATGPAIGVFDVRTGGDGGLGIRVRSSGASLTGRGGIAVEVTETGDGSALGLTVSVAGGGSRENYNTYGILSSASSQLDNSTVFGIYQGVAATGIATGIHITCDDICTGSLYGVVIRPNSSLFSDFQGIRIVDSLGTQDVQKTLINFSPTGNASIARGIKIDLSGMTSSIRQHAATFEGGNVGIGTSSPDASAILDLSSQTQGMLIPRMDSTDRDNIASPAIGLLIYNGDTTTFQFWDGAAWQDVGSGSSIQTSIFASNSPVLAGSVGDYIPVNGENTGATSAVVHKQLVARAGTFKNLYFAVDTAPGAGESITLELEVNGSLTGVKCTISDTNTSANDLAHTFAVSAGDLMVYRYLSSGGCASQFQYTGIVLF